VKIGIIGLGFMGATHIAALHEMEGLQLAAVCTTNERALQGDLTQAGGNLDLPPARYDFSAVRKYKDWERLVADPEIEAVDICLPTDYHPKAAIAALQRGKHVLCEKPMALTAGECERMQAAAAENKRVLMIAQVLRFWPEYEALAAFVRGGQHGELRSVQFIRRAGVPDWSNWLPREERSGGAVLDLLIHDIDQAIALFGMPESIRARSLGPVDTLDATLNYARGPQVSIQGGWLAPGEPFSMGFLASAEKGSIELSARGLVLTRETGTSEVLNPSGNAYRAELAYFAECCRTGNEPERCPPVQSREGVELAQLLKESRKREGQLIRCLD
jgi:predicted dehydrogenase